MEQDYQQSVQNYEVVNSDEQSLFEEELEAEQEQLDNRIVETNPPEVEYLSKSQVGPLQIIYIMFSQFKKECNQIAAKYRCKVRFSIDSYIIEQNGSCSKDQFGQCITCMYQFMNSIKVAELRGEGQNWNKLKYYYSPFIVQMLEKKKIKLTLFHNKIYGYSQQISQEAIRNELQGLVKNMIVHTIFFQRVRESYAKQNSWVANVYNHISKYIQLILEHYQSFFRERQITACIDTHNTHLIFHGNRARPIMEAKATVKNALQSMVCLFIKDTHIDHKTMGKYLKKASLYPIYLGSHNNHTSVIISKDNILKQLLMKSPNFMKYLGLEEPNELSFSLSQTEYEPSVGFYLIPSGTINLKIEKIKEKCQSKSYDIFTHFGVRYFKKVFIQQGKQKEHNFKDLLLDLLVCVEQYKQKFELMKPQQNEERAPKEVDDGLKYQIISGKAFHEELSSLLKRDVMVEKLRMKKKFIIAYNVIETKEVPVYWKVNSNGSEGEEVKVESMGKGTYFRGKKKADEKGLEVITLEELITIL